MPTVIEALKQEQVCSKSILQIGNEGEAVAELQRLLAYRHTYGGWIDGQFTEQVEKAVKTWQHTVFLPETGIVDLVTWKTIYTGTPLHMPELCLGCVDTSVELLQKLLRATDNYWGEFTSEFDLFTDTAVRDFQRRRGLVIDGIVGQHTWRSLSKVPH